MGSFVFFSIVHAHYILHQKRRPGLTLGFLVGGKEPIFFTGMTAPGIWLVQHDPIT